MTPRIIAVLVVALLALPATVSAKPLIHSVEACGEEACKEITAAFDVERYRHSLFGSTSTVSTPRDASFYRVLVRYLDGSGGLVRHSDDGSGGPVSGWDFLFAPEARAVLPAPDGTGSQPWQELTASRSAELATAVWDLRPWPASSLRAAVLGEQSRPRVVEVFEPAARDDAARQSAPGAAVVAMLAALLALAGSGVVLQRTRARRGRVGTPRTG